LGAEYVLTGIAKQPFKCAVGETYHACHIDAENGIGALFECFLQGIHERDSSDRL
jgi:hypothetical protein